MSIGSVGWPYGSVACGSGFNLARGICGGSFVAYDLTCSVRSFDRRTQLADFLEVSLAGSGLSSRGL